MTVSARDASQQPRTLPPTGRGLIDPHDRPHGRLDDAETCDRCGGDRFDVWITEGATSAVLKCVACMNVQRTEGSA